MHNAHKLHQVFTFIKNSHYVQQSAYCCRSSLQDNVAVIAPNRGTAAIKKPDCNIEKNFAT